MWFTKCFLLCDYSFNEIKKILLLLFAVETVYTHYIQYFNNKMFKLQSDMFDQIKLLI